LPVPELYIQDKIVSVLSAIQNKGELDINAIPDEYRNIVVKVFYTKQSVTAVEVGNNYQIDILKALRRQILQDAVQGKLINQDYKDEPASKLLERIKSEKEKLSGEKKNNKEKPLPLVKPEEIPFAIPESWIWCRLGEITNYGSSPKSDPSHITNSTWVLDLEDIEKESSKLLCKVRFHEKQSLSTKSVFKRGEVLYSKLRPYLDKVIVADEDGVCTTEILPLHCYSNLLPNYLLITLKRKDFLHYVNSVTKGMKMPRLGTTEGKLALIPLCPVNEQFRIVAKVEQLINLCDLLERAIQQNQKYTQELLHVALKEALEPNKN
jgi:type I restriction enzyme S subunit